MTRRQANALVTAVLILAGAATIATLKLTQIAADISSIEGSQADQVELLKQAPGRQR